MELRIEEKKLRKNSLIKNLSQLTQSFKDNHNDLLHRTKVASLLTKNLGELENLAADIPDKKYYMKYCIILHDILRRHNVARFSIEQINLVCSAISKLNGEINKDDCLEMDNLMKDNNLDWLMGDK